MMSIILYVLFIAGIYVLYLLAKKHISFSKRVIIALVLGSLFGFLVNSVFKPDSSITKNAIDWFNIVGNGYVSLLRMIVIPLIFVSVLSAIVNVKDVREVTRKGGVVITTLLITVSIAALVGIFITYVFGLNAGHILQNDATIAAGERIVQRAASLTQTFPQKIVDFIPKNPVQDLANLRSNSAIAVVIFSAFIGFAILGLKKKKPEEVDSAIYFIKVCKDITMRLVTIILRLTPYGIFALMTKVVATTNYEVISKLIIFVIASYVAIAIMFIIHLIILMIFGVSPIEYIKKSFSTLLFAFTSRTSFGTIPMTIEAQKSLGVTGIISDMAATFGATIGQNGCAGIYPAMLATMIAPVVGINPFEPQFILKLVLIIAVSSLGVAGVGGGATFASIMVLSSLNFPIELAGLLIAVEPLIDMARTALNVSDSIVSGVVTNKIIKD